LQSSGSLLKSSHKKVIRKNEKKISSFSTFITDRQCFWLLYFLNKLFGTSLADFFLFLAFFWIQEATVNAAKTVKCFIDVDYIEFWHPFPPQHSPFFSK
jgi:hypothetical protein